MANAKKRERRLERLRAKYLAQGGSPRKLRRRAEVEIKRQQRVVDKGVENIPVNS